MTIQLPSGYRLGFDPSPCTRHESWDDPQSPCPGQDGKKLDWSVAAKRQKLPKKLDDGWPESVEEQSLLLLLVWRHYITRQYIKDVLQADEKSSIKTILYGIVSFASYLSKSFSRTELFTDRRFCTQTLLHTDAFTHTRQEWIII